MENNTNTESRHSMHLPAETATESVSNTTRPGLHPVDLLPKAGVYHA